MASLTPEILAEMEARHVAFLEARLVSPQAATELRANVAAVHASLLATRVGDVVDGARLADALDATLDRDAIEHLARPLARRLLPIVLAELRADPGRVGDRVPASARGHLDALLARGGFLPERLLRELAEEEAVDEIMRDVLYDGFKEFAEKVNPFTAEWGIPSLLKRMSVLGGAVSKGLDTVRAEFDRRLEPEIRRFLAGFSRRGLRRMVDVTIARADQPTSVAVRRHLVTWVLEQEIGALARESDEEAIALAQEIGMDVAAAELSRSEGRARRRALVEAAIEAAKDRTVGEALASLGVTFRVDDEALVAALWPAVKAAIESAAVRSWLAGIVGEFYAQERARLGPGATGGGSTA